MLDVSAEVPLNLDLVLDSWLISNFLPAFKEFQREYSSPCVKKVSGHISDRPRDRDPGPE